MFETFLSTYFIPSAARDKMSAQKSREHSKNQKYHTKILISHPRSIHPWHRIFCVLGDSVYNEPGHNEPGHNKRGKNGRTLQFQLLSDQWLGEEGEFLKIGGTSTLKIKEGGDEEQGGSCCIVKKLGETLIRLLRNVSRGGGSTMIMIYPSQDNMKFRMKLGCTLMLCARTQSWLWGQFCPKWGTKQDR